MTPCEQTFGNSGKENFSFNRKKLLPEPNLAQGGTVIHRNKLRVKGKRAEKGYRSHSNHSNKYSNLEMR